MTSPVNKKQECQKCGTTFQYFGNRLRHELTCKGAFNQKCPLCFNEFKNKYSLTYHIKMCIARQELALKTKNSANEDEKQVTVKNMKKWKYCFFENCYCSFNKFSHLLTHIFSCHPNTQKYGFHMNEFETMGDFETWLEEEMEKTGHVYVIRTKKNNSCELACESQETVVVDKLWKLDGKLTRLVMERKLCTSRILITPYKDKFVCTYLNFHTHNMKLDNISMLEEKEMLNKLKSYMCLGVEMDDIYKQLIVLNGCEDMEMFNKLYGEVKKLLASIKDRILGDKLNKLQLDTDESDNEEQEMKVDHDNVIEIKSDLADDVIQIPMQIGGTESYGNNEFEIAQEEDFGEDEYRSEVTIKSEQGVFGEHLYCQVPDSVELDCPENVTPEMLQELPVLAESVENPQPAEEIAPRLPSKYKIKKGDIKLFSIKKKKAEQSVMKNVFASRIPEGEAEANKEDVPYIQEERIKSFLMERKKIEDELVKKVFSKTGHSIIEEALKISDILPSSEQVVNTYPPAKREDKLNERVESINAKTVLRSESDLGVTLKEKLDLIKKNLTLIDKYLDNPLLADEEVVYINMAVDDIVRKCEIGSVRNDNIDLTNMKTDGSKKILKLINYSKFEHVVMVFEKQNITIKLMDFFTLLSPATAECVKDILPKANIDYSSGRIPENLINAFFLRLVESDEAAKNHVIIAHSRVADYLQTSQDISQCPEIQALFDPEHLKDKTHMYVPHQYEDESKEQHWVLLVFHLEFHFYGILNPDHGFDIKQHPNIRNIINSVKKNLPKSAWRNMEYIRSYQINKSDSGIYICYYLERLVKKLPLTANINGPLYRLFIFETIRGHCMAQPVYEHKKCSQCKLHIISNNDKVTCKHCRLSFHISCGKSNDKDFVCPRIC